MAGDDASYYLYVAIDSNGRRQRGTVQADNATQAFARVTRERLTVVKLERCGAGDTASSKATSRRDQIALLRQLGLMLQARVDLMQALMAMQAGAATPALRSAIDVAMTELRSGKPLGACLSTAIPGMPSEILALVNAGEAGGCLAETIGHAVEQLEAEERIAATIKSALVYPTFLSIAGLLVGMIMMLFVIPRFATLIGERRDQLDTMSRLIFWLGDVAQQSFGLALIAPIIVLLFLTVTGLRGDNAWLRRLAIRHIPLLARLALQRERERWCRIMTFALLARISIVDAMGLAADGLRDTTLQERATNASRELRVGSRVADAIAAIELLDEAQLSLVRAGEESGLLADMFRRIAIDTEEGLRESLKRTTGVLEQTVVVVVSLFVGLIVYGLIASLTSVYEMVPL